MASKAHGLQKMKGEVLLQIGKISGIKGMVASKVRGIEKKKKSRDDSLLEINRIPDIIGLESLPSLSQDDPEAWDVQVYKFKNMFNKIFENLFCYITLFFSTNFFKNCRFFVQLTRILLKVFQKTQKRP